MNPSTLITLPCPLILICLSLHIYPTRISHAKPQIYYKYPPSLPLIPTQTQILPSIAIIFKYNLSRTMAKFTIIVAALFVALFALAEATTYTTITTTTIIEEENQKQSKCREQIRQQQQLSHCRMYLSPQSGSPQSRMAIMNAQEEHLQECCRQLQQLETRCVCKAIKQIVSQQPQGQQLMEQMMQDAQNLPRKCNIQLSQPCQIQAGSL